MHEKKRNWLYPVCSVVWFISNKFKGIESVAKEWKLFHNLKEKALLNDFKNKILKLVIKFYTRLESCGEIVRKGRKGK